MAKRVFDLFFASLGLLVLLPFFLFFALWITLDSKGKVFYRQTRVGRGNRDFRMFKFRTMHPNADRKGLLTLGNRDPRVTKAGYFLRKYKIDELPQLINVLIGDMSLVGPRPEVRKYVDTYSPEEMEVLTVRPGITDRASIEWNTRESEMLLSNPHNFEEIYIKEILRSKLKLNLEYVRHHNLLIDLKLIFGTVFHRY